MTVDDVGIVPAVHEAFDRLANKYGLQKNYLDDRKIQGYFIKQKD